MVDSAWLKLKLELENKRTFISLVILKLDVITQNSSLMYSSEKGKKCKFSSPHHYSPRDKKLVLIKSIFFPPQERERERNRGKERKRERGMPFSGLLTSADFRLRKKRKTLFCGEKKCSLYAFTVLFFV